MLPRESDRFIPNETCTGHNRTIYVKHIEFSSTRASTLAQIQIEPLLIDITICFNYLHAIIRTCLSYVPDVDTFASLLQSAKTNSRTTFACVLVA